MGSGGREDSWLFRKLSAGLETWVPTSFFSEVLQVAAYIRKLGFRFQQWYVPSFHLSARLVIHGLPVEIVSTHSSKWSQQKCHFWITNVMYISWKIRFQQFLAGAAQIRRYIWPCQLEIKHLSFHKAVIEKNCFSAYYPYKYTRELQKGLWGNSWFHL